MSKIIKILINIIWTQINRPRYLKLGKRVFIKKPIKITRKFLSIGDGVVILNNARLQGISNYRGVKFYPEIILCNGVSIQQNIHLTCAKSIYIGKNTAIAANVTITDINHRYDDITIPVEHQPIEVSEVFIDSDCKIYNNSVILPGVKVGKHSIIGANSVVTRDVPEYSVAVGAPAIIIKRYNKISKKWEPTKPNGTFLNDE